MKTIPGTLIPAQQEKLDNIEYLLDDLFCAGGVMLGQISTLTGLEPYRIQNWVKRGFLPPPINKRYTPNQLCRILLISMLQSALPMERICGLLTYINGQLDDESDDLIQDRDLYCMFVHLAASHPAEEPDAEIELLLQSYEETVAGAKERIRLVLKIMFYAWKSANLQAQATDLLNQINEKEQL